jgi:sulfoxide reductase heme-binding subunit YedZ
VKLIWPWQDRQRNFSWLKAIAFALVLAPAAWTAFLYFTGEYQPVPMGFNSLTYWSGVWSTVVLLAALAVTPAIRILRWPALVDTRRMIGVTALVYTLIHMVFYFGMRSWNWPLIGPEMFARWSLFWGLLSTIGLIVLGVTSLDAAIQRMGVKGWQKLHNTNYIITALAIVHVFMSRGTYAEQYILTGVFVWLIAWRLLDRYRIGADVMALIALTLGCTLFAALFQAGWYSGRQNFRMWTMISSKFGLGDWDQYVPLVYKDITTTLMTNFDMNYWDIGVPPAWQVLFLGSLFILGAALRGARRKAKAPVVVPSQTEQAPSQA